MEKFARLQTGIGTSAVSTAFFGPFELEQDADDFIEQARAALAKLGGDTCAMAISIVDEVPEGWSALPPSAFQGFARS